MRFFNFMLLFAVVLSCNPKNADERNTNDIKAKADSLARARSIATADSIAFAATQWYLYHEDPGTEDHDNSTDSGSLQLINDSVRVVRSGYEILRFRFPSGQVLDDASENKAEGYLELSPEQQIVFMSVRLEFVIGGLDCSDDKIPDALGADPDTTYTKTIHNIKFKVSEGGFGGRNPVTFTLYQFVHNNVCLSFRMDATETSNSSADPRPAYESITIIFEDFLGSLKMMEVSNESYR